MSRQYKGLSARIAECGHDLQGRVGFVYKTEGEVGWNDKEIPSNHVELVFDPMYLGIDYFHREWFCVDDLEFYC